MSRMARVRGTLAYLQLDDVVFTDPAMRLFLINHIFTARRYASAVYTVVVRPSVCPSVTNRHCIETTERTELVFGTVSSILPFYKKIWVSSKFGVPLER